MRRLLQIILGLILLLCGAGLLPGGVGHLIGEEYFRGVLYVLAGLLFLRAGWRLLRRPSEPRTR